MSKSNLKLTMMYSNHYLETMRGLTTIRAFGTVDHEVRRSEELIDASQRPAYLLAMIQEWLLATLTLVVGAVGAVGVVLVALATQLGTSASFTGASLLALMNLATTLTSVMNHYTSLETSLGAVNRVKTFSVTVRGEGDDDVTASVPESWPSDGSIVLDKVSASYNSGNDTDGLGMPSLALKDISLSIRPRQKVGICGRTGRYVGEKPLPYVEIMLTRLTAASHHLSFCYSDFWIQQLLRRSST